MASKRSALIAVGFYHAVNDGTVVAVAALFPILLDVGILANFTQIGILTAVGLVVTVVFQIIFGAWSDRVNPRLLLPAGMVILGGAALLTSRTEGLAAALPLDAFAVLLALVAVARVGASVYHPVGISWVGRSFKGELDHAMGSQSALGDLGVIAAFASSGFLGIEFGWPVPFILWGSLALVIALLGYALTEEADSRDHAQESVGEPWGTILRKTAFWILPMSIGGAAYVITINFGNSFLHEQLGLRPDYANLVIALWIGAGVLAASSFGRISTSMGRFRALAGAFLIIGVAGLLIGLGLPLIVLVPTFLVFGVGLFVTYPALFAYISESTEDRIGGATFGVVFGFQLLGGASAGALAGVMADAWGIHTPFLLLMGLGFVGFGLLVALAPASVRRRRYRRTRDGGD